MRAHNATLRLHHVYGQGQGSIPLLFISIVCVKTKLTWCCSTCKFDTQAGAVAVGVMTTRNGTKPPLAGAGSMRCVASSLVIQGQFTSVDNTGKGATRICVYESRLCVIDQIVHTRARLNVANNSSSQSECIARQTRVGGYAMGR